MLGNLIVEAQRNHGNDSSPWPCLQAGGMAGKLNLCHVAGSHIGRNEM